MLTFIISACSYAGKKSSNSKSLTILPNGQTLILNQIQVIKENFPDSEIILTVGPEASKVIKRINGIEIIENKDYKTTNCEDIKMALNESSGDELVYISGDILFNKESLNIINGHSTLLIDKNTEKLDSIGMTIIDEHITIMAYGVAPKWGKMGFFVKRDVDLIKKMLNTEKINRLFFFELINRLVLQEHRSIRAIEPKNSLIKVVA